VRGRGAAMKYLAHSASRNAGSVCLIPSHSGTEHLDVVECRRIEPVRQR
jgi:hypothetical protein